MEELGEFLRSRRSRLSPEEVGARTYGERRRVPGLRREELAQLAGVSVAYYTRLEQGLSRNASDGVLDALARALRLDADETDHLHALARPARAEAAPRHKTERARAAVRTMLAGIGDAPAVLIGYRNDILAWNRMGHALLFSHLPFDSPDQASTRPNWIRLIFCDPHMREFYVDWKSKAQDAVAYLRLASGQHPNDPRLATLIGDLSVNSPEFAKLWTGHIVRQCRSSVRDFRHPLVGGLSLNEEVLQLVQDAGQRIVLYSADPGSPSEAALRLLAGLTAEQNALAGSRTSLQSADCQPAAGRLPQKTEGVNVS